MSEIEYGEFNYYIGFENEFKAITKKMGKKTFLEEEFKNELEEYNKNKEDTIEGDLLEDSESESESDEEDEFDVSSKSKKISKNKLNEIKNDYLFYYSIRKNRNDEKNFDFNIIIFDNELLKFFETLENLDIVKIQNLDSIDISYLYTYINDLRINREKGDYKNPKILLMISFIEKLFNKDYTKMDNMIENNNINFASLWYYFDKVGTYYVIDLFEKEVCFCYDHFSYFDGYNGESPRLKLSGTIMITNNEGQLNKGTIDFIINEFSNKRDLDSFKIKKITEEQKDKFRSSSSKVRDLMKDFKQMKLIGKQFILIDGEYIGLDRNERVMVDNHKNKIKKVLPKCVSSDWHHSMETLKFDDELLVFPFLPVFNLGSGKLWGLSHFEDLSEVEFQTELFEKIVLSKHKKNLIKTLNDNFEVSKNKNLVKGKGDSLIFLFHGPPGVGKTLTAEATAEYLKKPLYQISIGDLNLDPSRLEGRLDDISENCKRWDAVLLIDEADIFLESRNFADITRNTIVSVFLRFLEYSKNIIFLTTNRLETLDTAVRSRINLMITYPKLSENNRKDIWRNSLKDIELDDKESLLNSLSKIEINGREINNMLNIVLTMLKDSEKYNSDEFMKLLRSCLEINNESDFKVKETSLYM